MANLKALDEWVNAVAWEKAKAATMASAIISTPCHIMGEQQPVHLPPLRVPKPWECPHCFRQRHPEPLTERMAAMYTHRVFDPKYDRAADTSPVVCIGADYYGPLPATTNSQWSHNVTEQVPFAAIASQYVPTKYAHYAAKYVTLITAAPNPIFEDNSWLKSIQETWWPLEETPWACTPNTYLPVGDDAPKKPSGLLQQQITFNDPNNWRPWESAQCTMPYMKLDPEEWRGTIPMPKAPGYDFSAYANKNQYYIFTVEGTK